MKKSDKLDLAIKTIKRAIYLDDYGSVDEDKPMDILRKFLKEIVKCDHSRNKVSLQTSTDLVNGVPTRFDEFICSCGVKVIPISYEEFK